LGNLPAEPTILRAGDSAKWGQDVNHMELLEGEIFSYLWPVRGIRRGRNLARREEVGDWIGFLCSFYSFYFV